MKTSEKLIKAKAVIVDPKNWTQKANARNASGIKVYTRGCGAVCYCSNGALLHAGVHCTNTIAALLRAIPRGVWRLDHLQHSHSLLSYNDTHTHEEVMELWDNAIALSQAKND